MKSIFRKGIRVILTLALAFVMTAQSVNANELLPGEELVNIAYQKETSASSYWNTANTKGYTEYLVDGEIGNGHRWISNYTKGVEKPEWVMIDLGGIYTIDEIVINFEAAYALEYDISGSEDNVNFELIKSVVDGKRDVTVHKDLGKPEVRYLKFDLKKQANINYGFSIHEIEVYDYSVRNTVDVTAQEIANYIATTPPSISEDGLQLILPNIDYDNYEVSLYGSDNQQIITLNGDVIQPLHDMTVNVLYKITHKTDSTDFAVTNTDIEVVVPGIFDTAPNDNKKPKTLPSLREWKGSTGTLKISQESRIVVQDNSFLVNGEILNEYLKALLGFELEIISGGESRSGDIVLINSESTDTLGKEGYYLEINDKVNIKAPTKDGSRWGVISVAQMLYDNKETLELSKGIARDYPKYEVRSGMIDVGRVYIPIDYLEEMTMYMAWFKNNEVQIHLNDYWGASDYSAFRLESEVYPEIVAKDGHYTKEEYRQYQINALRYGIDVVSEIDTPYHAESFRAIPGVKMLSKGALDIRDPFSYTVIENLFDEYIDGDNPVFISNKVHIGTDEYNQNYKEEMRHWTDHFINYINEKGKETRLWGSLGGGTSESGFEGETPVSSDATMNIWAPYWSDVQEMYDLGYDIINTVGGWLYIVPGGAAGYPDRLDLEYLYENFEVNNFAPNRKVGLGDAIMPKAHPQTKGAEWALWNDNTSFNVGFSEFDLFDRMKVAISIVSEKTWYGEKDTNQSFEEFNEKHTIFTNTSGIANPGRFVESSGDTIVEYTSLVEGDKLVDQSGNGFDAILENVQVGDNGIVLDENSVVTLPFDSLGYPYTVHLKANLTSLNEDSSIFFGKDGAVIPDIFGTGKLGYTRLHGDYIFDYELPLNQDLDLIIVVDSINASLYVDGVFVSHGVLIEKPLLGREQLSSTFVLPTENILKNVSGTLYELKIENYAKSKEEIGEVYGVYGYRENLALNKNIIASSNASGLTPNQAVDGDRGTRWGSNYTNGVEKPEWLVLDLGEVRTISETRISWEKAFGSGYTISASIDGETYEEIFTMENGTGNLDINEFSPVEARYVRFDLTEQGRADKRYGFSIWELEIYEYSNAMLKEYSMHALEVLESVNPGYLIGYFPADVYESWKQTIEDYLEMALGEPISEYEKVSYVSDIHKKLSAIESMILTENAVNNIPLETLISNIEELDLSIYTAETVLELESILQEAKLILINPLSSQTDLDDTVERLDIAFNSLELIETPVTPADKTELKDAIANAEAVVTVDYTEASVNALRDALASAKATLEDAEATQEEVDAAIQAIEDAVEALVKKDVTNIDGDDDSDSKPQPEAEDSDVDALPTTGVPQTLIWFASSIILIGLFMVIRKRKFNA